MTAPALGYGEPPQNPCPMETQARHCRSSVLSWGKQNETAQLGKTSGAGMCSKERDPRHPDACLLEKGAESRGVQWWGRAGGDQPHSGQAYMLDARSQAKVHPEGSTLSELGGTWETASPGPFRPDFLRQRGRETLGREL